MGSIDAAMIHSCQVLSTSQDQKLSFNTGSAIFTVGKTLSGATSKATGIIKTIVLSSGSWSGTAAGYLILYSVSGAFVNNETIQDDNTTKGTAKASGTLIPQTNAAGTPTTTTVTLPSNSTYYDCLFQHISTTGNYTQTTDVGKMIYKSPMVSLKSDAVIKEGDYVTTTETNWIGTYEVQSVDAPEIPFSGIVDHIEAFLKKVAKRG